MAATFHESLDYWADRYKAGDMPWCRPVVEPFLIEYIHELLNGRTHLKVLVPLCGKSLDLKFLADLGLKVVGVEGCDVPIKQFFDEQSIECVIEDTPSGTVHRSTDNTIRLYHCDLFDFSVATEGQFDAIWDKASLAAINHEDRVKYSELMLSLLKPDGRYLLRTAEHDEKRFIGPPCNVEESTIRALFGERCDMRRLADRDMIDCCTGDFCPKLEYFRECVYALKFK